MKALKIERAGTRDPFRFSLGGVIDPQGARTLDRLLLECQARGAQAVHLDFNGVTSMCTLGATVLARYGRVYEETERRIHATGLGPEIRAALAEVDGILYESNAPGTVALPEPAATTPTAKPPVPIAAALLQESQPVVSPEPEVASLQAKLKRKIVEFRNLFEITRALNLALDLDEVLNLFSLSVMGQFGVDRLAVFLSDPHRNHVLVPKQVRGFAHDHFQGFAVSPAPFRGASLDQSFFTLSELTETEGTGETVEALRQSGFEWGVTLWVRRELEGILLLGGRSGRRGFQAEERDLLTTLANQGAVAISNARYYRAQEDRNLGLARGMISLIESRDMYAKGNTERIVRYVTATAKLLHYPTEMLKSLIYGAVLRDIGMISVSQLILKNPAHLSDDEWALIKQHPTRGAQILEEMNLPREVVEVVQNHHERWGGEGYPRGIKGEEIPLGARIVSLVDGYVAMTAERPYRRALPYERARQVISENWGSPFDPAVVEVFLQVLDKIGRRTRQRLETEARQEIRLDATRPDTDPNRSVAAIPAGSRS